LGLRGGGAGRFFTAAFPGAAFFTAAAGLAEGAAFAAAGFGIFEAGGLPFSGFVGTAGFTAFAGAGGVGGGADGAATIRGGSGRANVTIPRGSLERRVSSGARWTSRKCV
jgi:hypothetical protein